MIYFYLVLLLKSLMIINASKISNFNNIKKRNIFFMHSNINKNSYSKIKIAHDIFLKRNRYFENGLQHTKILLVNLLDKDQNEIFDFSNNNIKETSTNEEKRKKIKINIDNKNNNNYNEEKSSIKATLSKTKKFCNYLTNKLGRLNKKLREIKKLEAIFYANPNILTEAQQVKLSKKKHIKNEIVLINRYRKKYFSYKRNLMKNIDDLSPFFYSKKKKKKQLCTSQEFAEILKSENPKEAVQNIKNIDINKIPRNITDYLIFNKIGTREDIKILFGLKAIKINGNAIDDENYILNVKEDEVKVFDQVVRIHEDHYVVRKRFTKNQKQILEQKENEKMADIKKEVKGVEQFFNIKK
ncbi:RNA-binding protein, putative [Plasmodium berghei ANKA]|uniref:RNA-binding protein, putative n=1 Tax=Plasmodium berghei (strain Anka) TaxID=5823 RepID=A0A509AHR8_PLABA|nr:RNA-binding protein, putative [Plasmodium berghei ANKA]VUC55033.1 RNA-binding protein, putative [Plasmodium berghei ANKA]|eukprot:XP_034420852.1 RNA-binding protein, putative [Plasmodium berghei ANKA]